MGSRKQFLLDKIYLEQSYDESFRFLKGHELAIIDDHKCIQTHTLTLTLHLSQKQKQYAYQVTEAHF